MNGRRIDVAAGALAVAMLAVTGCGSAGSGHVAAATAGGSQTPATSAAPTVAPNSLAPAGPAPGGGAEEPESHLAAAVTSLVSKLGCQDLETQAHLPVVDSQATCRRGTERVYLMTFGSTVNRDAYLQGTQVVQGGFNVVGPTWVVHVEDAATAQDLGGHLIGHVQNGS